MTKPKTMNNIIKILIIVVFFQNSHSQKTINNEIEDANYVKKNIVFFYKNSWEPFTGNIIVETVYKNQKLTTKIKFKNGFDILEEYINPKNKKLVLTRKVNKINTYDIEVYDSINLKTVFKKNTIFTDTTKIQKKFVINYYCENSVRTKIEKLNGFVKSENTKTYFVNGMKTKIEYFFRNSIGS